VEPNRWCRARVCLPDGTVLGDVVLAGAGRPDMTALEALAGLVLAVRRLGLTMDLIQACPHLRELLELAALPLDPRSGRLGSPPHGERRWPCS
jgi:hypothetical protein